MKDFLLQDIKYRYLKSQFLFIYKTLNAYCLTLPLPREGSREDRTKFWLPLLLFSCKVMSDSLRPHGLYNPSNSPGQNTGVGSHSLLQIFPTQGLNPGLPHCRQILYQLSHKRSPRILEWVAYPFSIGPSQPRNRTGVSCIAGLLV